MSDEEQILQEPLTEETVDLDCQPRGIPVGQSRPSHFGQQGLGNRSRQADQLVSYILLPTDFSPNSTRALKFAISLAQQCRANLMVLHVIDINAQSSQGERLPAAEMMGRLWEKSFEQMGKLADSLHGQVDAQTAVEEGLPWEQIVEKSRQADLVVLGKQDKPGWKLFARHTAQRVIENAACPVIMVQDPD